MRDYSSYLMFFIFLVLFVSKNVRSILNNFEKCPFYFEYFRKMSALFWQKLSILSVPFCNYTEMSALLRNICIINIWPFTILFVNTMFYFRHFSPQFVHELSSLQWTSTHHSIRGFSYELEEKQQYFFGYFYFIIHLLHILFVYSLIKFFFLFPWSQY